MIEFLTGKICRKTHSGIILDCQGVGYGVTMPLSSLDRVPDLGESFSLWIYTKVREDSLDLFGFLSYEERQTFGVLLQISGVGPKVAIGILSTLDLATLKKAVQERQTALLQVVPGIGLRSAEKILLELSAKIDKLPSLSSDRSFLKGGVSQGKVHLKSDLSSALVHLGFKEKDVQKMIDQVLTTFPEEENFAVLVKKCLSQVVSI